MQITTTAHAIRVRFAGPTDHRPARWIATWEGWPDDRRPVRRTFDYDDGGRTGGENFAERVAQAYVDWLNKAPAPRPGLPEWRATSVARGVTVGSIGPDEHVVLVDVAVLAEWRDAYSDTLAPGAAAKDHLAPDSDAAVLARAADTLREMADEIERDARDAPDPEEADKLDDVAQLRADAARLDTLAQEA